MLHNIYVVKQNFAKNRGGGMMKNIVGLPARGKDFFNREELIQLVWDYLEQGNNILLAAPRRYGKTSLMYQLIDNPRNTWKPIHVDAESIREPVNFIIALLDALMADDSIRGFLNAKWEKSCQWLRGLIGEFELTAPWDVGLKIRLKEKIGPHWQEKAHDLLRLLQGYDKERLLIIIDELPVMLHLFQDNKITEAETKAFLYWFRKLRTDPKMGLTNVRFLVGGSIGIENYLSQLGAVDAVNDFQRIPLSELSLKAGADFLKRLLKSRGLSLSNPTQKEVLKLIGRPIPYFIQIFVATLATEKAHGTKQMGPQTVERIYRMTLLGTQYKPYFQHYYDRLRYYSKLEEGSAKALLKALAIVHPRSIQKSQLRTTYRKEMGESATDDGFNRLMADLLNDFYIRQIEDGRAYIFDSKVLCDWWRRYYAF
jgi:hypothetical protein